MSAIARCGCRGRAARAEGPRLGRVLTEPYPDDPPADLNVALSEPGRCLGRSRRSETKGGMREILQRLKRLGSTLPLMSGWARHIQTRPTWPGRTPLESPHTRHNIAAASRRLSWSARRGRGGPRRPPLVPSSRSSRTQRYGRRSECRSCMEQVLSKSRQTSVGRRGDVAGARMFAIQCETCLRAGQRVVQ
jgi:hypothetical protein